MRVPEFKDITNSFKEMESFLDGSWIEEQTKLLESQKKKY